MNHTNIAIVLLMLAMIMIMLSGCGTRTIGTCDFNPGVTIESKSPTKDKDNEQDLPVKVSPKGEVSCTF